MSCPDWGPLVAHRFEVDAEAPPGWERALAHLETCPACRRRALAVDPTLVFHRLEAEEPEPREVASLQTALAALRRADRVGRELGAGSRRRRAGWAAAAVLGVSLALLAGPAPRLGPVGGPAGDAAAVVEPTFFADDVVPLPAAAQPLVEALDRPQARVYQFGQEDLALVMIVDESLDV